MRVFVKKRLALGFCSALLLGALAAPVLPQRASQEASQKKLDAEAVIAARFNQSLVEFRERVRDYVRMRERIESEKLPKLSKEATAEQIEAHKASFQQLVRDARADAKPGDLFNPKVVSYIRAAGALEYEGRQRQELRETLMEAENKDVPLRVNHEYPEDQEKLEVPPTLLLRLPELPKQVKYRFVGRHVLLVDRENGLIIDYALHALPVG